MAVNAKDGTIKNYLDTYYTTGEYANMATLIRFQREAKKRFPEWLADREAIKSLKENYTSEEIRQIATGKRISPTREKRISFQGKAFKFAHITDTHFGASCFKEHIWDAIVEKINSEKVHAIFHTGDVVEGMNNQRLDMFYDVTHLGYGNQKAYAIELLSRLEAPIYAISGNHDRWYIKSAGAHIVKDIADSLEHMEFLGEDMADFVIENNDRPIKIRMWHGEDSSSYAISYRIQKLVESFSGGDKPNVLLCGHTHKAGMFFERNIHCVTGGAVCTQSNWMKGKRLANHTGFYMCEVTYNERGVVRFKSEFFPFYE